MYDPHVAALYYRLETDLTFDNPPPLHWTHSQFGLDLDAGKLTVALRDHFTEVEDARRAVEPFLKAWEIDVALRWQLSGRGLHFSFDRADLIDRQPTPGSATAYAAVAGATMEADQAHARGSHAAYPPMPMNFLADSDVETLWLRYSGYLAQREPLAGMAYFCLTVLLTNANADPGQMDGYHKAERQYHVKEEVLRTLCEITSTRGDRRAARKARYSPLQPQEVVWVQEVIRQLIIRAGEVAYDPRRRWPLITMADFPKI